MNEPENSLQLGIAAYKAGEKANARTYLLKAVREQPDSEQAWGWLSNTVVNAEERIHCLRQVVRINPANKAAGKLLTDLESNEWLTAGPPVSVPTHVAGAGVPQLSAAGTNLAPHAAVGSDAIQIILLVLLVGMVLFWLSVGFLQLAYSFDPIFNFDLLCFGGGNIVFSIYNGFMIAPLARREKGVPQQLYFLATIGSVLGMTQLLFSAAYLQVCAVPLYILLGILAYANREAFVNEAPPRKPVRP